MDAHLELAICKKQKLSNIDRNVVDNISNLPEDVLLHVLSFLSTKDVIQTSILSKRWQFLWTSSPSIDLEDLEHLSSDNISQNNFIEFVNRVITLHDASDIKTLRLRISLLELLPSLNLWTCIALNHNIQELDLSLAGLREQNELPCQLFTCPSLVSLKISARLTFKPSSSTYFVNLRKLHLSDFIFSDDVSIQYFLSNCPVLEDLSVFDCDWKNIESVTISIPTLKILYISTFYPTGPLYDCLIKISSRNITNLKCSADNIYMCELPSLEKADVYVIDPNEMIYGSTYMVWRLLPAIYNVRILNLSYDALWTLVENENLLKSIPTFLKMTHLELGSTTIPCHIGLMEFLSRTPNLENLNLWEFRDGDIGLEDNGIPKIVPSCFKSSLKIFSMSFFEGHADEMKLISLVMRNAVNLQKMIIFCAEDLLEDKDKRVLLWNQLIELPKVSRKCIIELHKDSKYIL